MYSLSRVYSDLFSRTLLCLHARERERRSRTFLCMYSNGFLINLWDMILCFLVIRSAAARALLDSVSQLLAVVLICAIMNAWDSPPFFTCVCVPSLLSCCRAHAHIFAADWVRMMLYPFVELSVYMSHLCPFCGFCFRTLGTLAGESPDLIFLCTFGASEYRDHVYTFCPSWHFLF